MNSHILTLQEKIAPLREAIINHKIYSLIENIDDIKRFMRYHSYAVWDFMSLLKTLQNNLTCTKVPWFPEGNANTRFLINEIVVGEEADVDANGVRKSHFELYLEAMSQSGASIEEINTFITTLKRLNNFELAYSKAQTPLAAQEFVNFTFSIIASNKPHVQAAVFTFGREDLIPGMFYSLVQDLHKKFPNQISDFIYYLERHIEIDGDHHSNLALEMTATLCGENETYWDEATTAAIQALKYRIALWDAVYNEIQTHKKQLAL